MLLLVDFSYDPYHSSLKVAAVQMDVRLGDVEHNLLRIQEFLSQAATAGAQLVVFPECALTGYCFESLEDARQLSETIPGSSTERLQALCTRFEVSLVVGMLEQAGDQVFNACVAVTPRGVVGSYRKVHLPQLGVDHFVTPGDRPFQVVSSSTDIHRIGMLICYDLSFPEATRVLSLDGADLITLPTNWPPGAESTANYVVNARASENKVYVIAANRVGTEGGFTFIGKSKICDVYGNTLAFADHQQEAIIHAEIDLSASRSKRIERVPGKHAIDRFADRRPEFYNRIIDR